jgi:murein DD-endopeptidase MepM/ murein hydrolase activator NlpD
MRLDPIAAQKAKGISSIPTAHDQRTSASFDEILTHVTKAPQVDRAYHAVRRNETLSGICLEHLRSSGVNPSTRELYAAVAKVAEANRIEDPDVIWVDQKLDLSVLTASTGSASTPTRVAETAESERTPEPPASSAASLRCSNPVPAGSVAAWRFAGAEAARDALSVHTELLRLHAEATPKGPAVESTTQTEALGGPLKQLPKTVRGILETLGIVKTRSEDVERSLAALEKAVRAGPGIETGPPPAIDVPSPWNLVVEGPARLTSGFGMRHDPFNGQMQHHNGVDLAAQPGAPIYALKKGLVVFSGWQPGYGKVVILRHSDGLETVYGHNERNLARKGQTVAPDSAIALVGSSGRSTGPHLHFEVRKNGRAVDPIPYLKRSALKVAEVF